MSEMSCVDEFKVQIIEVNNRLDKLVLKKASIGTKADDYLFRQDIQNEIVSIKKTVDSLSSTMKQIDDEKNIDAEKCKESLLTLTQRTENELKSILKIFKDSHTNKEQTSGSKSQISTPLFEQVLVSDEQEQIDSLEEEVIGIISVMREIQSLYNKVFQELQNQRNLVVLVDSNVSSAKDSVVNAKGQLITAEERQKHKTSKLLKYALILLIICIIIGIIIYLSV